LDQGNRVVLDQGKRLAVILIKTPTRSACSI